MHDVDTVALENVAPRAGKGRVLNGTPQLLKPMPGLHDVDHMYTGSGFMLSDG